MSPLGKCVIEVHRSCPSLQLELSRALGSVTIGAGALGPSIKASMLLTSVKRALKEDLDLPKNDWTTPEILRAAAELGEFYQQNKVTTE